MKTELCEIAYKYGTDKCLRLKHPYTPFYYSLLKDKRESIKKVLEMGIGCPKEMPHSPHYQTGASLYMWRDFFPNARIYGADILPETMFKDERIETFLCDETKKEDLTRLIERVGSDIDLFIDDGSHSKKHQIFMCQILMPLLKKDVIYIIEDVKFPDKVRNSLSEYDCQIPHLPGRRRPDRIIVVKHKYD